MTPSSDLIGHEVVRWFEEKLVMGTIALSVEQDPDLHGLSCTMQAMKKDLKSSESVAALKPVAHAKKHRRCHRLCDSSLSASIYGGSSPIRAKHQTESV